MIIPPWVRRSVLRGNLLRGFGKRFVGILVPHTESAISLADLRPKSGRTYAEHMNLPLLHISFVSRFFFFTPVSLDLNLRICPELFHCLLCITIHHIGKKKKKVIYTDFIGAVI